MKKEIRNIIILIIIGLVITGLVFYFLGIELAVVTLVVYGIVLDILAIIPSKKDKK